MRAPHILRACLCCWVSRVVRSLIPCRIKMSGLARPSFEDRHQKQHYRLLLAQDKRSSRGERLSTPCRLLQGMDVVDGARVARTNNSLTESVVERQRCGTWISRLWIGARSITCRLLHWLLYVRLAKRPRQDEALAAAVRLLGFCAFGPDALLSRDQCGTSVNSHSLFTSLLYYKSS